MSFREIAITVRAVNHASAEFSKIQTDAESLAVRVRTLGSTIAGIGAAGTAIGYIANQFGLLNDSQAKVFNSAMMVVSVMGMFMRTSIGLATVQKIYASATAFATFVQNSLNISFATFLALTGVGIAVIAAAALAMIGFANSMNSATSSIKSFNIAASEMPTRVRTVQREAQTTASPTLASYGEETVLYRRGIE